MAKAKISRVQGRTALVLPEEVTKRFRLMAGDSVTIRETPRGLVIDRLNPLEEDNLRDAEQTLQKYKDTWRYAGG